MSRRALISIVVVAACHPRAPQPPPEPERETCLGASEYTVAHRREGEHVLVEAIGRPVACDVKPSTEVLVDIPVSAASSACPIGEPVLERTADGKTAVLRTEFFASLDADARAESTHALDGFVREDSYGRASAFLVSCTPLRWVFVETAAATRPRWTGWTYTPPAAEEPDTADTVGAAAIPSTTSAPSRAAPSGPPSCAAPPPAPGTTRWIGRSLSTGAMPGPSTLDTFVLDRIAKAGAPETARLVTFTQRAAKLPGRPAEVPPPVWTCESSKVLEGAARRERSGFALSFTDGDESAEWTCKTRSVRVAAADTLRDPLPQLDEECKRSKWRRAGDLREILVCEKPSGEQLILARGAGVEHVTIDEDDCGDRTAALRSIGRDGAVRIVRRYAR